MPIVVINLPEGYSAETKRKLAEAIHKAIVEILGEKESIEIFNELSKENLVLSGFPQK